MPSQADWVATLSPWPADGFGLGRMRALLAELGDPQLAFPAIHVVGTNGKSTATRTAASLLRREGLRVGAYTSPHVAGWHERLDADAATLERALARVRPAAAALGATQFETLTAAALAEFAAAGVDAAVVEAGLGGRLDATNVLRAPVVLLTNVDLDHTDVLGGTREAIAREKLAVAGPKATVVLGEPEWERLLSGRRVIHGGAREAAAAFLGRTPAGAVEVELPGRLERRGPELWDGAHNVAGTRWLVERLPHREWTLCASILSDKDVEGMLRELSRAGRTFVATASSSGRALPAEELAALARPHFDRVLAVADPPGALLRARAIDDRVLVTGSLYLLADLAVRTEAVKWPRTRVTG
jgi:dihydrofolate synthase / folylpolyglutamate synthase